MKYLILYLFAFSSITFFAQEVKKLVIVIDAGHGGSDPGNLNQTKGMKVEKDLNLLIALKLGNYITQYLGHKVEVIYTRKTDVFIHVRDRVIIGNNANAAYFISIHCNSAINPNVFGTETHIHNIQSKVSRELGLEIEKQFKTRAGRNSRGLKLRPDRIRNLMVLKDSKMPAVLVESGFMTNKAEEAYLNSDRGQDLIASAVFRGFRDYVKKKHKIEMSKPGESKPAEKEGPVWKVQIMASTGPVSLENPDFKQIGKPIEEVKITNSTSTFNYKYYVGSFSSKRDAKNLLKEIKKTRFTDAYLVKFE
jgi:N-acetylmuramoyl-L-alanine amidase